MAEQIIWTPQQNKDKCAYISMNHLFTLGCDTDFWNLLLFAYKIRSDFLRILSHVIVKSLSRKKSFPPPRVRENNGSNIVSETSYI